MVAEAVPRRHTREYDPLLVAETNLGLLGDALAEWRTHIEATPPHNPQDCAECMRHYRAADSARQTIGFRVTEQLIRKVRTCEREGCGNEFIPVKHWQRYCSAACRQSGHRRRQRE